MMGKPVWIAVSVLGMTLLASGTAVAQNQPRYDYSDPADDQDSTGSDYDNRANEDQVSPRAEDDFSDVAAADEERAGSARRDGRDGNAALNIDDEEVEAMTDGCARAAREEAERNGDYAEVRQMEAPRENRDGFRIDGDVESRSHWRAQDGRLRHFTCTVANGRIEDVYFQRERAAR